jgi:RHS repeat-associated protein
MKDNDCPSAAGSTITSRAEETYGYDDLDRLDGYHAYFSGSQTDSGQWTYDALDRVSSEQETHPGVSRSMAFDYIGLSDDVAKETWTGNGATTRSYSYDANGNKVGVNDTGRNANLLYAYNPHGDVSQLLTLTGSAQAAYGYRPYGDEEAGNGAISQGDTDTQGNLGALNNYRFSAKRFDSANKQINMGARFFSPEYGTFIQEDYYRDALADLDLATDPLTGTRYGLTGGNPINFVEIDGHGVWGWTKKIVGTIVRNCDLLPAIGSLCSAAKAIIAAAHGDWKAAVGNALGALPVAGQGFKVVKLGAKGFKEASKTFKVLSKSEKLSHEERLVAKATSEVFSGISTVKSHLPQKGEGFIYLRVDKNGKVKPYVGQSKNKATYERREKAHAKAHPGSDFEYVILGRPKKGELDRAEEYAIRKLGGPTTKRRPHGRLSNKRHQMNERRYRRAGGDY